MSATSDDRFRNALSRWVTAVLAVPTVALSALLVFVVERCAGPWVAAVLGGIWVFAGVVLFDAAWFTPNRQSWAAFYGFRKAIGRESEILTAAWENVTRAPGLDGWPYSLWVQQSASLNAYAAPTRIVAVTSWAIVTLRPRRLEAVLAHELGHHVAGDQRLRLLAAWSAIPGTVVKRLAAAAGRPFGALGRAAIVIRFVLALGLLAALYFVLADTTGRPVALSLCALFAVEPLTAAARSRRAEFAADRFATDLGYGRDLAVALRRWQRDYSPPTGLLAVRLRWYGGHPPIADRLRALRTQHGHGDSGRSGPPD